jgi:hypothetical protein
MDALIPHKILITSEMMQEGIKPLRNCELKQQVSGLIF